MQIHHTKWILSGSLFPYDIEVVFSPNGRLEVTENGEALGKNNPWKRIDNRVEFSVCNPTTGMRHTHFIGSIYDNVIKGACYKVTGEVGSFEAVLFGTEFQLEQMEPMLLGSNNAAFFLAHGVNLN